MVHFHLFSCTSKLTMKRSFPQGYHHVDSLAMANCLVLLSRSTAFDNSVVEPPSRVFECKTCNRQFPSFQALGGHRASHKKPKLIEEGSSDTTTTTPTKPKTHECSICGLEFAIGQALGGHMRRHKAVMNENQPPANANDVVASKASPVVMKKSNSRRVLCLDLNLTPLENDHQEEKKAASSVLHRFL